MSTNYSYNCVFSNYIAVNDNKNRNNYEKPTDLYMSVVFYKCHYFNLISEKTRL